MSYWHELLIVGVVLGILAIIVALGGCTIHVKHQYPAYPGPIPDVMEQMDYA